MTKKCTNFLFSERRNRAVDRLLAVQLIYARAMRSIAFRKRARATLYISGKDQQQNAEHF